MSISTSRQSRRQAPKMRERLALEFVAHGKAARIDQVAQVLAPGYVPATDDEPRRRLKKGEPKPPPREKGGKHEWPMGAFEYEWNEKPREGKWPHDVAKGV